MEEDSPSFEALGLMRKALAALDQIGETLAACYLQGAIDALLKSRPIQPGEEIDDELGALIAMTPMRH